MGRFQLEEFIGATYLPLARVVEDPDIIREEEGHVDFGTNATAEFAAKGGESKERIQKAVDYWYAKGLDMFGNSKSYRSERYMFWGLKRRPNAVARQAYKDEIDALILKMGLQLPESQQRTALHLIVSILTNHVFRPFKEVLDARRGYFAYG